MKIPAFWDMMLCSLMHSSDVPKVSGFFKTAINIYQLTQRDIPKSWTFSNTAVRTSDL